MDIKVVVSESFLKRHKQEEKRNPVCCQVLEKDPWTLSFLLVVCLHEKSLPQICTKSRNL